MRQRRSNSARLNVDRSARRAHRRGRRRSAGGARAADRRSRGDRTLAGLLCLNRSGTEFCRVARPARVTRLRQIRRYPDDRSTQGKTPACAAPVSRPTTTRFDRDRAGVRRRRGHDRLLAPLRRRASCILETRRPGRHAVTRRPASRRLRDQQTRHPSPSASRARLPKGEGVPLLVRGLDLVDGTPVLDLKPYVSSLRPRRRRAGSAGSPSGPKTCIECAPRRFPFRPKRPSQAIPITPVKAGSSLRGLRYRHVPSARRRVSERSTRWL